MSDHLDKAKQHLLKQEWSEAAKELIEASRQEPDFDKAADLVILAGSLMNNMRINSKLRL